MNGVRYATEQSMKNNTGFLRSDREFMVDVILGNGHPVFASDTTWSVFAENKHEAVSVAMRKMFGFRSHYSAQRRRVYRVGRHGRIRKVLAEGVKVEVSAVGVDDA